MTNQNIHSNQNNGLSGQEPAGVWPPVKQSENVLDIEQVKLVHTDDTLTIERTINKASLVPMFSVLALSWLPLAFRQISREIADAQSRHEPVLSHVAMSILLVVATMGIPYTMFFLYVLPRCFRSSFYMLERNSGYCVANNKHQFLLSNISRVTVIKRTSLGHTSYLVGFSALVGRNSRSVIEQLSGPDIPLETHFDVGSFKDRNNAEQVAREIAEFAGVELVNATL